MFTLTKKRMNSVRNAGRTPISISIRQPELAAVNRQVRLTPAMVLKPAEVVGQLQAEGAVVVRFHKRVAPVGSTESFGDVAAFFQGSGNVPGPQPR